MNDNAKHVTLTIDGQKISVSESLTILEAARQNGIEIPTLCHHPALSNWGGCRLCVVEVDASAKLAASCVMPVRNGMDVVTNSAAITQSRRMTLELLFAERNHNCMFCPASGDCELQKTAYALQMDHLTVSQSFSAFPTDTTGEYMTVDHNRCILCGRCVRACHEIAGSYVLGIHNRGPKTMIGFDLLENRDNSGCTNCGACLQVCPTGAITNRYRSHYAVKGHSAKRTSIESVCAGCGLLCPTKTVVCDNQILSVEGILTGGNGRPDRGRLCYKGRFEVLKNHGKRLLAPMIKDQNGKWCENGWDTALDYTASSLTDIVSEYGSTAVYGIASSNLSNEALHLFKTLMVDTLGTEYVDTPDGNYFRSLSGRQGNGGDILPGEVSWDTINTADMVLIIGADIRRSHPMLISLLRQANIERELPIATIGRSNYEPMLGGDYLSTENIGFEVILESLAKMITVSGGRPESNDSPMAGQWKMLKRISRTFAAAVTPLILTGQDLILRNAETVLQKLSDLLQARAAITGYQANVSYLKPMSNSMAAWLTGVTAQHATSGDIRGGIIIVEDDYTGALTMLNDLKSIPDFLVVVTPYFHTELAVIADVLLPCALWTEEDGSFTSMDGSNVVYKPKVIDPPANVEYAWKILQHLKYCLQSSIMTESWDDIREKTGRLITNVYV